MKIDILTLFPEMFKGPFDTSMLKKAQDIGAVEIGIHDLRDWTKDKHKTVDSRPFGGGKGMVLMVEPINDALKGLKSDIRLSKSETNSKSQTPNHKQIPNSNIQNPKTRIVMLSPQGKVFDQKKAQEFSKLEHLILLAGHYEGFDERIREYLIDEEISIGDYVLTGGEIPAMVIVDSVVRLLPDVLDPEATQNESFSHPTGSELQATTLDYPQYTRPVEFMGQKVPEVLLSGNHTEIEKWRKKKALEKTRKNRPDLLK